MSEEYVAIVKRQTEILLRNVQATLDIATEQQFEEAIVKWPLWKRFYHLLHSLDQWFVNPFKYTQPAFHQDGLNYFDKPDNTSLSKAELQEYFQDIRQKINSYVAGLTDASLLQCPEDCKFTRLDLIVGQNRHLMYNLGMIHIMLQIDTGKLPEYIGISQPVNR
jgi:DinB superfamily